MLDTPIAWHAGRKEPLPTPMRWLRVAWRETPSGLRAFFLALWSAGAILLGLGWWGDESGFWAGKPFLTNVFSSLTAVSFGVPFAVMVLGRIGVTQTEDVEARAARRLAATVTGDFALAVVRLRRGPRSLLREAKSGRQVAEATAQEAIRKWETDRDQESLQDLREFISDGALAEALESFRKAVRPGRSALPLVADVSAQWSFLNGTVRSRLLETGGRWLDSAHAAEISEMVGRLTRDPYMDGWLRDADMAVRRFSATTDLSAALRDLWVQLELGADTAEAVSRLSGLASQAARVLANPAGAP